MPSLLDKHLEPSLYALMQARGATPSGFTIEDAIRSGRENPDSSVGVYAGDAESYEKDYFGEFFDRIIDAYHGFGPTDVHRSDLGLSEIEKLEDLDPAGEYIVSTRIRVGRNLREFPFAHGRPRG